MIGHPAINRPRRTAENTAEVGRIQKIVILQRAERHRAFVRKYHAPTTDALADPLAVDRGLVCRKECVVNVHGPWRSPDSCYAMYSVHTRQTILEAGRQGKVVLLHGADISSWIADMNARLWEMKDIMAVIEAWETEQIKAAAQRGKDVRPDG